MKSLSDTPETVVARFNNERIAGRTWPLAEQLRAGAVGFKIHEDWGATHAVIDEALKVADEFDVQVAIHTDTLNECGFVEDTRRAIGGRVIHTFHTEGAGGGHAPDIITLAQVMSRLVAYVENRTQLVSKVKMAFTYPIIVAVVAVLVNFFFFF